MMKAIDRIHNFLAVVIGLILVFMTLSIGYAIFVRAVNLPGPLWIVQFNEYAMLFATFLGSSWLLSKGRHVSVELVVSRFSMGTRKDSPGYPQPAGLGSAATLCWYGPHHPENSRGKVIHVRRLTFPWPMSCSSFPWIFLLVLQFYETF
jgi:TRAP-type C4-dicarboxylate transport system permease small subunit